MSKGIVYIVDDDASVREGLSLLLTVSGFSVETFASGEAFLRRKLRGPGCVVLDLRMEGVSGHEVLETLNHRGEGLPVLITTAYGDIPTTVRAMHNGAKDFITKPVDGDALVTRIEQVVSDHRDRLDAHLQQNNLRQVLALLTRRERQVLSLAVEGLDTQGTAQRLGISPRTVEAHRSHIVSKTGVQNLAELFRLSARMGVELVELS
jgi:FixJ family two-component response regulator